MKAEFPSRTVESSFSREDAMALVALALLFAAMLIASWQRWTQPLLDHGREMNLPARILAGEQLYNDVQFLYGPFAPYFNALLYDIFGIHLSVLKTSGAVSGALILLMIYWLARQLMSAWESALAAGLVLVICALKSTASYVQPYAYAALYGLVFALGSLIATASYLKTRRSTRLVPAGLLTGLSLISKPEIALAALAAAAAALIVGSVSSRKLLWRDAVSFISPVIAVAIATYGFILNRVPPSTLLEDNHVLFTEMPPQLVYFNRHISGLAQWPDSLWFTLAGIGVFTLWVGLCGVIGSIASARKQPEWRSVFKIGLIVTIVGVAWREAAIKFFKVPNDVTPFASAALILPAIVLLSVVPPRPLRLCDERDSQRTALNILLLISIFSLVSILRAILNVTTTGPYTPFFIPSLIIIYLYLLFRAAPELLSQSISIRANVRRAAMLLIALLIIGMAINSAIRFRRLNTFIVSTPHGSFVTIPEIGEPLAAAIKYVEERTKPDDHVLALPVATTINFLTARRYPLREEIVHPGFLTGEKELDAIERIKAHHVPLILIANLDTSEFRDRTFGVDYNQPLMQWINENYRLVARFDSDRSRDAAWGDALFFILAYERNR
jgi:4-amino-4-deoxy-L-arabinose transferase-like glycosyltransferase